MSKRLFYAISVLICLVFLPPAYSAEIKPGLARLHNAPANAIGTYDGVATFGAVMPNAAQLDALRSLGLKVQPLKRLPFALLRGAKSAMKDAVTRGIAHDVYPNDKLHFFSDLSNIAINADEVHETGVIGTGVGIAIVDSGIDGSHPDLTKRMVKNKKVIELFYDGQSGTAINPDPNNPNLVLVSEAMPFNNTDTTSGHGTHVAGIAAGDKSFKIKGVAPGAGLYGYGTGEAIFVFGVLSAFDDILLEKERGANIRIVNNSWGSSFRMFDPAEPINKATEILHGAGLVVVFAAGNSSTEMALNPYSAAPWVVSVGNASLTAIRATSSSGGIEFDNSVLMTLPQQESHLQFIGDRIGLYHPSVSAPGSNIESTAALTGLAVNGVPCIPGTTLDPTTTCGVAVAGGTSMAAPHVAGLVALMYQKNPNLTVDQVKDVLQVTVTLMRNPAAPTTVESFYKVGYGFVDAKAAVDLVGRHRFKDKALAKLKASADKRVLGDRDYAVRSTDYWWFEAAPVTAAGTPDKRVYSVFVSPETKAIKALVSYPSLGYVGLNQFNYKLSLFDSAGKLVKTSTPFSNAGVSTFFADLTGEGGPYTYSGTPWTLEVSGEIGAQDQDVLMGILVSVAMHQLVPQVRVSPALPTFNATGALNLLFHPKGLPGPVTPEGCFHLGPPDTGMGTSQPTGTCESGNVGYAVNYGAGVPALFTTAPLTAPVTLGGETVLSFYLVDPTVTAWINTTSPRLTIEIDAIDANGELVAPIGAQEFQVCQGSGAAKTCLVGADAPVKGTYTMYLPPITVPEGLRISVGVRMTAAVTSSARTVYGGKGLVGGNFSDAGVRFTTGTLQ
jgi:serine protease AprX